MALQGLKEFRANLQKVNNWTNPAITRALEHAAGNTINHIKTKQDHQWGKPLGRKTTAAHPHKHFYVWSQELINSLHRSKVKAFRNGAEIEIIAGGPDVDYAPAVELGGPNRRAFPFLVSGLEDTTGENERIMATEISKVFG